MKADTHIPPSSSRFDIINLILLVLITLFTFHSVTQFDFLNWDDDQYILANPRYQKISSNNFFSYFKGYDVGNYHPLTMWSYSLDFRQGKPDAAAMHRTNLILHVLNTVLIYLLLRYLSFNALLALAAAALFSVHPFRVEAVAWISARKDLLMLFFYLSALASYLYYYRNKSVVFYFLSLLLFAAACLSKATAVTLPLVLALYLFMVAHEKRIQNYLYMIPFFALALTAGIVAIDAQHTLGAIQNEHAYPLLWRVLFALSNAGIYWFQQIIPAGLQIYYPYSHAAYIHWLMIVSAALLMVVCTAWVWVVKPFSEVKFYFITGGVMLFPVLQLIPVGEALRADRYMYAPALFWSMAVVLLLHFLCSKRLWLFYSATLCLVAICLLLTLQRLHVWRNSETLWTRAIAETPQWAAAYNNLGMYYLGQGKTENALRCFKQTLAVKPDEVGAYINLGFIFNNMEKPDSAYVYLHKGVELFPENAIMLNNFAQTLYLLKHYDEALTYVNRSIQLKPDNAYAWRNRALMYEALGEKEKCCADIASALQLHYTEIWGDDMVRLQDRLCR